MRASSVVDSGWPRAGREQVAHLEFELGGKPGGIAPARAARATCAKAPCVDSCSSPQARSLSRPEWELAPASAAAHRVPIHDRFDRSRRGRIRHAPRDPESPLRPTII
jgi:hypothetical protein